MVEKNKRNTILDSLKGFAIFLVVWGHTIQCLGEGYEVMNQPIGKFIYMFHMPLFFFCSGFFPAGILKSDWHMLIKKRWKGLLVPTIIWSVLSTVLYFIFLENNFGLKHVLYKIGTSIFEWYWFVYVLLMCIIYSKICISISNLLKLNKWTILGLAVIVLWFLPEFRLPFISYLRYFKGFYPFFLMGWLFSEYRIFEILNKKLGLLLVTCCVSIGGYFVTPRKRIFHIFHEHRFYSFEF